MTTITFHSDNTSRQRREAMMFGLLRVAAGINILALVGVCVFLLWNGSPAISWEFLTEVVGLEPDRLYPSIYLDDDEAFDIWNKEVGIPAERIFRFGKEDNFWEHGSGPCGPCSEIYYDRGPEWGCGKPGCTVGCDCDRYIEIWNNVFSQFDNDGHGHYTELKQKNIDTGMGLERLACVCQDVASLFLSLIHI